MRDSGFTIVKCYKNHSNCVLLPFFETLKSSSAIRKGCKKTYSCAVDDLKGMFKEAEEKETLSYGTDIGKDRDNNYVNYVVSMSTKRISKQSCRSLKCFVCKEKIANQCFT